MEGILTKFLFTFAVIAAVIGGFAIKMFFKKDGQFKGGCAANNPMLVNEIGECGACGRKIDGDEQCDTDLPKIGA